MPYKRRPAIQSRTAAPDDHEIFGLGAEWDERIATSVVVVVAVMIVALIAVLMGMA
jgi:hypothetical protein